MTFKRLLLLIILICFSIQDAGKITATTAAFDQVNQVAEYKQNTLDKRAIILQGYLDKYNSPLQYHAQDFVDAADFYNLDYKLVAAIAGVESTFGKFMPGGVNPNYTSYNAWGWGVYGNQAIYFKSFREGIFTVSAGLRKNYLNRGYTDPYLINKMYSVSPAWAGNVTYFLNDMEKYEKSYVKNTYEFQAPRITDIDTQIAGQSALLAMH